LHPNPNIQYQPHLHTLSLDLKMFRVPNFSHQGSWFWVLAWDWEGEKRRWAVGSGRREKGEGRRMGRRNGREEKRKKHIKKTPKNTSTKPTKPWNQSPPKNPPSKIQTMAKIHKPQTPYPHIPTSQPKATAPKQHLSRPSFPRFPKPSS